MKNVILNLLRRLLRVSADHSTIMSIKAVWSARNGAVQIGSNCILHCRFSIDRPEAKISVGDRCFIGASHLVAAERIVIEDDVIISWGVTIDDHDSHSLIWDERRNDVADCSIGKKDWGNVVRRPVRLCSRSWIGFNATILKGVTVGEGAVVGACSVVTRDVEPFTVVAGNPARVVKRLDAVPSATA